MLESIFLILAADSFTYIPGLPRPSKKENTADNKNFYSNMHGPFLLDTNVRDIT